MGKPAFMGKGGKPLYFCCSSHLPFLPFSHNKKRVGRGDDGVGGEPMNTYFNRSNHGNELAPPVSFNVRFPPSQQDEPRQTTPTQKGGPVDRTLADNGISHSLSFLGLHFDGGWQCVCCECCIKTIAYGGKQIKVAETPNQLHARVYIFAVPSCVHFLFLSETPFLPVRQRRNAAPFHNASPSGLT
ncbi:hypothetical protein LZ31DRAFT_113660 [Colletotrichum somersetense]|nr:hypothetical protein LZ31DRAFT_113660 [Colletotrichum somersetense]